MAASSGKEINGATNEQGEQSSNEATEKEVKLIRTMLGVKDGSGSKDVLLQTITGTSLVSLRNGGSRLTARESLFLILNEPGSGPIAYLVGKVLQICLVLSALCTTYETVSFINEGTGPEPWMLAKILFNIIFSIEAAVRIVCYIPFKTVHRSTYVWLDLVTCLPLYMRLFLYPDSYKPENYLSKAGAGITIRVMEAMAGFRILKLCRYYEGASLLAMAVGKSLKQLYVPLFMLLLMVFCFAAIVFEIEFDASVQACVELWKDEGISTSFIKSYPDGVTWDCSACTQGAECQKEDAACILDQDMKCKTCNGYPAGHPECAPVVWGQTFQDIPRSMWFMFVTVSTVGYGDVSPTTWQGQIFVCMVIICGLIFLAMPLAIVGSTFGQVWDDRQVIKLQRHIRQLLAQHGIEPTDAVSAFKKIDADGNGDVGFQEFKTFLFMHGMEMEKDDMKQLWSALDLDKSGTVTIEEFMERTFPDVDLKTLGVAPPSQFEVKEKEKAQGKQLIELMGEQKERQEALDKRLDRLQEMIAELSTPQERRAGMLAELSTKQMASSKKLRRSQSHKTVGGRSGSKAKPSGKIFGRSGRVLDGGSLDDNTKRSRPKKRSKAANNSGKFSPTVSISSDEQDDEGSSSTAVLRKLMA
jgi:hypothetical protein